MENRKKSPVSRPIFTVQTRDNGGLENDSFSRVGEENADFRDMPEVEWATGGCI